jgi:hypothetical protein
MRLRPLPGAGAGLAALALVVAAAVIWRFAPVAGIWTGLAAVGGSWLAGRRLHGDRRWLSHFLAAALLVSAVLLLARHQDALWPCETTCRGGAGYELLFGVPVVAIAFGLVLVLQLVLAGCHLWCRDHRESDAGEPVPPPLWIQAAAWALIGGSLFYLWTAWRLGMVCAQCCAFHTTVLALAGALRRAHLRVASRLAAMTLGFLALLAAYGPTLRVDLEPVHGPGTGLEAAERAWRDAADAGRVSGRADAALTLEVALDFQCPHCANAWDALARVLDAPTRDGRMRVVIRHVSRRYEPASADLARWAFAAAAEGRHRAFVVAMLGSRANATADELLRSPGGQAIGLDALARRAQQHRDACEQLRADDTLQLNSLRFGGVTPLVVLRTRDGRELGRWSGDIDAAAVGAAITSEGTH